MKQYIDKIDVVAEIESYINSFCDRNGHLENIETNGLAYETLCDLKNSIDTLEVKEVKEEPVSKDLEEAAEEYAPDFSNSIASKVAVDAVRDAFKAGAEWLAGQGETLYDTINVDGKNQRWLGENLLYGDYNAGQAVIVQIRKV